MVQLVTQNIDGLFQTMEMGPMKLDVLQQWINQNQVVVFAFSELSTCCNLVNYEDWLPQKMQGWWEAAHFGVIGFNLP